MKKICTFLNELEFKELLKAKGSASQYAFVKSAVLKEIKEKLNMQSRLSED